MEEQDKSQQAVEAPSTAAAADAKDNITIETKAVDEEGV